LANLLDGDGIGFPQSVERFGVHLAENADGEPGAGKRVPAYDGLGEPQLAADLADLILEEVAQGLDERQLHRLGQPADIVVGLDGRCSPAAALDDIRVERPLGQERDVLELVGLGLEDPDELLADPLALLLGVGDTGQSREEALPSIDVDELEVEGPTEDRGDAVGLALAHEPVVHEDAGETLPDGPPEQGGAHGGVDTATEPEHDALAVPHPGANAPSGLVDEAAHGPVAGAARFVDEEVTQQLLAEWCVRDLGMELHAVEAPGGIGHGGYGRVRRSGGHGEARRGPGDQVAVAHPACERAGFANAFEEPIGRQRLERRTAVFLGRAAGDLAVEEVRDELVAVADAKDGHAGGQELGRARGGADLVDAGRASREDDGGGLAGEDPVGGRVEGQDLAVDAALAHFAGYELGVLGAEVEDEGRLSLGLGAGWGHSLPPFRAKNPRRPATGRVLSTRSGVAHPRRAVCTP